MRWALVICFLWLAGRFWDPYYGFTRFIQLDGGDAKIMVSELRGAPIYSYREAGGYDGATYAQIAVKPRANDPELARAIDSLPYRARRILLSWIAYALGWGEPTRIVHIYSALNLGIWLGCAWLLAKIIPPTRWKNTAAWAGVLFSAGALHSVRLALTDLAAMGLIGAAFFLVEKNRRNAAAVCLGAVGLVRETAILGGLALWAGFERTQRWQNWLRLGLTFLPLAAWLVYLKLNTGPVAQGMSNFAWPVVGLWEKIIFVFQDLGREKNTFLAVSTCLSVIGLTVQLGYAAWSWDLKNAWSRLAIVYAGLMLWLGAAVWEGHPGAATRVLLPLTLAFNVLAARRNAGWVWLLAGNLSVVSGVLALWHVPREFDEIATGRSSHGAYVVHTTEDWYRAEQSGKHRWAWCASAGDLTLDFWPRGDETVSAKIAVRAFSTRSLEIRQNDRVIWQGTVEARLRWIELPELNLTNGSAILHLSSGTVPQVEGPNPGDRQLGFAVYGLSVN